MKIVTIAALLAIVAGRAYAFMYFTGILNADPWHFVGGFSGCLQDRVEEVCRQHPNMDMTSYHMVWQKAEFKERQKLRPIFRRSRYARWTRH